MVVYRLLDLHGPHQDVESHLEGSDENVESAEGGFVEESDDWHGIESGKISRKGSFRKCLIFQCVANSLLSHG